MRAFLREEARRAVALRAEPCHSLTAGVRSGRFHDDPLLPTFLSTWLRCERQRSALRKFLLGRRSAAFLRGTRPSY